MPAPEVEHDPDNQCFQTVIEGRVSTLSYTLQGSVMTILSTFVSPEDRGGGIAAALVEAALSYANDHSYQVRPVCSYVDVYMKRSGSWHHLRAE